jgi:hypothetical protein
MPGEMCTVTLLALTSSTTCNYRRDYLCRPNENFFRRPRLIKSYKLREFGEEKERSGWEPCAPLPDQPVQRCKDRVVVLIKRIKFNF